MCNTKTFTLQSGWNELKYEVEQQKLCDLLSDGWSIVSTGSLPDRIIYVLVRDGRLQEAIDNLMDDFIPERSEIPLNTLVVNGTLKSGVSITKNGRYSLKGKGFIKEIDAYE